MPLEAIYQILAGNIYLSEKVKKNFLIRLQNNKLDSSESIFSKITDRELEVFNLIAKGNSIKEIADILCLSKKTVETYQTHLKEKLNLPTATELRKFAIMELWLNKLVK